MISNPQHGELQAKKATTHREWIRTLPKVSLHCHLEGTVSPQSLLELSTKHAIDLRLDPSAPLASLYTFKSFSEFLLRFRDVCAVLKSPGDYARVAQEHVAAMLDQHVRYAEVFISPSAWQKIHPNLDLRATVEEIAKVFSGAKSLGLEIALIVDLTRNFGPVSALETVEFAISTQDLGVIGVGLGGDEVNFPAPIFVDAFALARRAGLHCVAHAGEAAGAQSVRDTVDFLHVERIGHGMRAAEDPAVLSWLSARGIPFEQSPTSNQQTGVISGLEMHPIDQCVAAGIRVAIDADDPAMFQTTITDELAIVHERFGSEFLYARLSDAVTMCFADDQRRQELDRELQLAIRSTRST